jgi:erythromycin esterase
MVIRILLILLLAGDAAGRGRAVRSGDPGPQTWLRDHAVILESLDRQQLEPILPLIGDARILALGDATHGTHEFLAFKRALIPLLVEELGFRTIVFEAPFAEFQRIDDFVQGGDGDLSELLASTDYFFWDTQEVADVLLWARAQNAAGIEPRIRIAGADCAHPATTAEIVLELLRREDPALAREVDRLYGCVTQYGANWLSYNGGPFCTNAVRSVRPILEGRFPDRADILYAARIVEQGEEAFSTGLGNRDAAMAENIDRLLDRHPAGKIIVWGHNEHFGETEYSLVDPRPVRSVGSYLTERHGQDYFAIGSIAFEGTFNASEFSPAARASFVSTQTMTTAGEDDYASLFRLSGIAQLFVSLEQPLPQWLAQPHRMRFAGSGVLSRDRATLEAVQNLREKFDAVLYVETSTPSLLRRRPVF